MESEDDSIQIQKNVDLYGQNEFERDNMSRLPDSHGTNSRKPGTQNANTRNATPSGNSYDSGYNGRTGGAVFL